MKHCYQCNQTKDKSLFYKNKARPDGLQTCCIECSKARRKVYYKVSENREAASERSKARKQALGKHVFTYLSEHPCVDCGESDPIVLEFDHVRGQKVAAVSKMVSAGCGLETLVEEIAKCAVRCANCHRRRTANTLGYYRYLAP